MYLYSKGPIIETSTNMRFGCWDFSYPGLEAQMELEAREIALNAAGADVQEGIRAFVEKRPPAFRGRR